VKENATSKAGRVRPAILTGLLAGLFLGIAVSSSAAEYASIPTGNFISVLSSGNSISIPVKVESFSMRTTPVTIGEYLAFVRNHPEWKRGSAPAVFADSSYLHQLDKQHNPPAGSGDRPITSVSWFAAQAFCENEGGRLPSWYEWEYVAAADEKHADARRDPAWRARILSWYSQSSTKPPATVGGASNYYGVRDMHGLVWEWVDDFNALLVSADSRNQGDPDQLQYCGAGAISLQDRENYAVLMRVALLSSLDGADTTDNLGFRCVRSISMEIKK
jgi:sulfatase modifying factor 1